MDGDIHLRVSNVITAIPGHNFMHNEKEMNHYGLKWEDDSWNNNNGTALWMSGFYGVKIFSGGEPRIAVTRFGKVGINTVNPQSEFDVNGTITAKQLKIDGGLTIKDLEVQSTMKVKDLIIVENELTNKIGYGKKLYFGEINDNTDDLWVSRYNKEHNKTDLRINIGDDNSGDDNFVIGNHPWDGQNLHEFKELFVVSNNGNVGIGQSNPQNKLEVNGIIRAKGVKMEASGWADFVFNTDYKLPSLSEVENHIQKNKHLPGIPSEKEVKSEGIDLAEMQAKLLQKIEELTLYIIEQDKQIKKLQDEVSSK